MSARVRALWLALALWGTPALASACAVCTGGENEDSAFAFILMTVFMSSLPLVLIGTIAWFLRRAFRQREARSHTPAKELASELRPSR